MKSQTIHCCCCGHLLGQGLADWHRVCGHCGYESAEFAPAINRRQPHEMLDEVTRDAGLKNLRITNFSLLLDRMLTPSHPGASVLDVGAAHGWFVALATARGCRALGLEPDKHVFDQAVATGANMREGFFPDALQPDEAFDAIVFNDVFEHIPDAIGVIESCKTRMNVEGVLVLNLPSSRGVLYRVSKILYRLGLRSFFERLWQKDLPSPHLHYFHADNLTRLCASQGLFCTWSGTLPSLHLKGLYARITYVKTGLRWLAPLIWLTIVVAYPLLRAAPSDIEVLFFKQRQDA